MAIWELATLLVAPRRVFRDVYYRRREHILVARCASSSNNCLETKDAWARDDPGVIVIQCALLICTKLVARFVSKLTLSV